MEQLTLHEKSIIFESIKKELPNLYSMYQHEEIEKRIKIIEKLGFTKKAQQLRGEY